MIWIENINDLQYYNTPQDAPCYCEMVVFPTDMILQGILNTSATSGFALTVYVYSADGLNQLENATSYFEYYFALNPQTNKRFFNLRLKTFSAVMCSTACYILRVVVTQGGNTLFDKFTERYCQNECCDTPRGIIIEQDAHERPGDLPPHNDPPPVSTVPPVAKCGESLIRLRAVFDCTNLQTLEFFGLPTTVYSGTASFQYQKVVNIAGRIAQRPREIRREISYNCKLQRAESFIPYFLESTGWTDQSLFPAWKMKEIEAMFHANHLYVWDYISDETEYQFAGGTMFRQIYNCWELFKLETTLQTCEVRQIFGCGVNCDTLLSLTFLIPHNYLGDGFYDENRLKVANDIEDLVDYFLSKPNVISVSVPSPLGYDNVYSVLIVEGTGLFPDNIYFDSTVPKNRIYGTTTPESPVINCAAPVVGEYEPFEETCATPILGTYVPESETGSIADIASFGNWTVNGFSDVNISGGYGKMDLLSENTIQFANPDPVFFTGDIIGIIAAPGWPSQPVTVTNEECSDIPEESYMIIDVDGTIRWYGLPTLQDGTKSEINLPVVYYKI